QRERSEELWGGLHAVVVGGPAFGFTFGIPFIISGWEPHLPGFGGVSGIGWMAIWMVIAEMFILPVAIWDYTRKFKAWSEARRSKRARVLS
ncbi:MAG TPA: hypothetical protein VHG93_29395, partial [Longimicrobium sp.]|nr:hypothetical protein [Longimicrobium sp.]